MNAKQRRQYKRSKLRMANMVADSVLSLLTEIKEGKKDINAAISEAHEFKRIIAECV